FQVQSSEFRVPSSEFRVQGAALRAGFWISASIACDIPPAIIFGAAVAAVWLWKAAKAIYDFRLTNPESEISDFKSQISHRSPSARKWLFRLLALAAGAAPLLALFAALDYRMMGTPLPSIMNTEKFIIYEGSIWDKAREQEAQGKSNFYKASYTRRLWHATVGHKGVFWMTPLLALAAAGAFWLYRRRAPDWRMPMACLLFLLVSIAVTMKFAYDLSGGSYVIRHVLPCVAPLFCVLAHPGLRQFYSRARWRRLAWTAGFIGCPIAWLGVTNPWSHNTYSAYPPLENVAQICLQHPRSLPIDWIGSLIEHTSVTPDIGWLDFAMLNYQVFGRLNQAERALIQSIEWNPNDSLPYYHLGIIKDMLGRPDEAIVVYQKYYLPKEPGNSGGWNNLMIFALHARRWDVAEAASKESLRLTPGNPKALWGQLAIEDMNDRRDPNSPLLREALRRHPDDPLIREMARRWGAKP
ncbi:MAG: hypothetical protein NTX50_24000, partial [Candidatus Sumerlaeota bacterium]|nr:hypothetical protein [Candidatus Sumerlaeota bacterium]